MAHIVSLRSDNCRSYIDMGHVKLQCIRILLLILAITACHRSFAETASEDFLTTNRRSTADLIWNSTMGILHTPLTIYGWDYTLAAPAPQNRDIDVGTGEHGSFGPTTYANFDIDGNSSNNVIVIDTDQYPNGLNVTNFELSSGVTLSPVGDTPLVIKSFSDIVIVGTIDCSGANGTALNATNTSLSAGGQGRCGGGDGGNGGTLALAAVSGSASGTAGGGVAGGAGGASGGIGGGGGGSYNLTSASQDNGENPNVAGANDGGVAGAINTSDAGFALLNSGGGGGGGSASTNGVDDSSGGGGGAGGGAILLMAFDIVHIANSGMVVANGGNGGGGGANLDGGGGGAGGGGSIAMFAGNEVINDRVLGVSADGGTSGVTTNLTNGGSHGGAGVTGRIWMTDLDGALAGAGSEPGYANVLVALGNVRSREGLYTATSTGIELFSSISTITAVNLVRQSSVANTVTVEFASGDSPGFNPVGQYIDSSLFVGAAAARFVKFKVTLNVTNQTQTSPQLDTVSLTYRPLFQTQFDFESGSCGRIQSGPGPKVPDYRLLIILLLPLLTIVFLKRTARSPRGRLDKRGSPEGFDEYERIRNP